MSAFRCVILLLCALLAACSRRDYSPGTYASAAAQQANKVSQGVIVGVRPVDIRADGVSGAVAGGTAGALGGSQGAMGLSGGLTALGGSVLGGMVGSSLEHGVSDTFGYEYIVRKPTGDLVSVVQKDKEEPLKIGTRVLVIEGNQARVVPDYITAVENLPPFPTPDPPTAPPPP